MLTRIKSPKDFFAGTIFLTAGLIIFIWSHQYEMGTATRMGPGYYPSLLGIVLGVFGLAAIIKGILAKTPEPLPQHKILPLIFLLAAVISFALLIERAGLVITSFVCISLACYQRLNKRPLEVLLIFLGLTTFNYVVFILIFSMPISLF